MTKNIIIRPILRNISLHRYTKCFFSYFAIKDLFEYDCRKFLVTIFFFVFFLCSLSGPYRSGRSKISRHYFVFCLFYFFISLILFISRGIVVKSDKKNLTGWVWFPEWTVKYFSSLFCFCICFLLSIYLLYSIFARDSCKKWQENTDKLGVISQRNTVLQRFLVNKSTTLDWKLPLLSGGLFKTRYFSSTIRNKHLI